MTPFIILDRDGVINAESADYIKSVDEWRPLPGSIEAIAQLTTSGYDVFVATNQAGIAKGKMSLEDLSSIHQLMLSEVERAGGRIIDIQYCPHHPNDNCKCRKPKPGMLFRLAEVYGLNLELGYFVGDSMKDLQAAKEAGCNGVLVLSGNGVETFSKVPEHTRVHANLAAFVKELLSA